MKQATKAIIFGSTEKFDHTPLHRLNLLFHSKELFFKDRVLRIYVFALALHRSNCKTNNPVKVEMFITMAVSIA